MEKKLYDRCAYKSGYDRSSSWVPSQKFTENKIQAVNG